MRVPVRSVAWLLPFFLSACFHKTHQTQDQTLAPSIHQDSEPIAAPAPTEAPPVVTAPAQPAGATTSTTTPPQPAPKPPVKHKPPVNKNPQQASIGSPGVSAIGELSSGDPIGYRSQTEDLISSTERGLNGITRPLDSTEQKTADHIREFLKQAKAALATGDVDGAHTLAAKAKVLLSELTR